jgi:hypothetical protein
MGDQVVEEVGPAHRVDVVIGYDSEFVFDLAPDVVALLLNRTGRRAGVVEAEVDLGMRRHPDTQRSASRTDTWACQLTN